jgi:two-component system, sensor histidine kinase and response regulator
MGFMSAANEKQLVKQAPASSATNRQILLVVDDEEGPRQSIRIVFKDDYSILMADNGKAALQLAREHNIDAAVLDIRMPGMSGIEVLNGLKEIDPATEVVMLTAYETLETARQALRLGACDYLNKPFDIASLREAVRTAMERRSLSLQIRANNQRLSELQDEIQNQKVREELARTRGEIYASIIHDINGPLTVISGFIEMINQRITGATHLEGEKLEIVKDRLNRVTRQVTSCIQISNRYLSFLRGGSGGSAPVGINQILSDLGELLKTHVNAQKNTLLIRPLPEDVAAQINGTDLIQILLNLCINALQSSEKPHEVEIDARQLSDPLDLSLITDGAEEIMVNRNGLCNQAPLLAIAVSDNGSGIPSDSISKIFDPYFTTKPVGQGTGLGLSIVRRLVEEGKGAIHVKSQMGVGTCFTVYLPCLRSIKDPEPGSAEKQPSQPSGNGPA